MADLDALVFAAHEAAHVAEASAAQIPAAELRAHLYAELASIYLERNDLVSAHQAQQAAVDATRDSDYAARLIGDLAQAVLGDPEVALGPSTAHGRRIAVARRQQTFVFETLECDEHGGSGRLPADAGFDVAPDRDGIGPVSEAERGEEDEQFELAQRTDVARRRHILKTILSLSTARASTS
jgi:hypothetical protein